jgi:hypothetical protein
VGWGLGVGKTEIKGKREKTIAAMQNLYITIKSEKEIMLLVETSKCCL